jgi:tetratricopeptide (TPR) repeat protein
MKIGVILYFASFFGMLSPAFGVNPLLSIQTTSPLCTSTMDLGVGRDYFVAIGNDLPGLQEYNQLVKLYQTRRYKEFSEEIKRFYKIFESSPLKEAAYFLEAQELFEEYLLKRTEEPLEAEKKMREALLLYPKSEMVPVLLAGAGNFWLQRGVFEKSLGIYQSARDQFPFHPLYCVFQMGIGESAWQLGDRKAAKSSFTLLQQKCENSRLKLASEFRLMELENPEFNQITPNDKRESKMDRW